MDQTMMNREHMLHRTLGLIGIFVMTISASLGQTEAIYQAQFDSANAAYARGEFSMAQSGYESLLEDRVHFASEFNLGNAFFKQQKFGLAILHYERARQLTPNNEDLETNLTLANSQISDRIEALHSRYIQCMARHRCPGSASTMAPPHGAILDPWIRRPRRTIAVSKFWKP